MFHKGSKGEIVYFVFHGDVDLYIPKSDEEIFDCRQCYRDVIDTIDRQKKAIERVNFDVQVKLKNRWGEHVVSSLKDTGQLDREVTSYLYNWSELVHENPYWGEI